MIDFTVQLLRDQETFSVRYACACGCRPQVKLRRGSAAAHEHCCCGIAHAAGAGAAEHLARYLAERRARGDDPDRVYRMHETEARDPWGGRVPIAYAIPSTA